VDIIISLHFQSQYQFTHVRISKDRSMATTNYPRPSLLLLFVMMMVVVVSGVWSDEQQLLMNLKSAFGAEEEVFDSWSWNNSVCEFRGITCDYTTQVVKEIDLSHQNLEATTNNIPFDSI